MEHGQEAHPPSVGRIRKAGTHRHLPFKGCIRDDISVPPAMDGKGWQRSFQPVHPQAKGKDRAALNGGKRAYWLVFRYSVVPQSGKPYDTHKAFQWLTLGVNGVKRQR